jgi:N6-L-threonylcarbamoyladenine synthase
MIILGIETSCDETAASILEVKKEKIKVLSNVVSSQIKLHAAWGGVVPNLAAREHLKNIFPVIHSALQEARIKPEALDLIGVTSGPGLIPALLIGVNAAKTLAYIWEKPLMGIHHIEGHIYANFIGVKSKAESLKSKVAKKIKFPALCLVVSGGHTQLVLMKKHLYYKIIGETQDDAAGEAFDKVARILGLGYPGGPIISQLAACNSQPKIKKSFKFPALPAGRQVSSFKINLPRPMIDSPNFNFSFSGLKTAVLYETKKHPELMKKPDYIAALCQEFQNAATEVLIAKTIRAAQKYHPRSILLAGGVSANLELRKKLGAAIRKELKKTAYYIPEIKYALDNSAMIAAASFFRWKLSKKKTYPWQTVEANANLKLSSL